jgi:hypothetical protein
MTPVEAIIAFLKENGHEKVEIQEPNEKCIALVIGHVGKWVIEIRGFEIDICEGVKLNLHDPNSLPSMLEIMDYCASPHGSCSECKWDTHKEMARAGW